MTTPVSDIAFTPAVKAHQTKMGSRHGYARMEEKGGWNDRIRPSSANLCVESHLREFLEQGFEVAVVKDATAAAITPELGDGYAAAVTNYGFIANAVVTTEEAVQAMAATKSTPVAV